MSSSLTTAAGKIPMTPDAVSHFSSVIRSSMTWASS